LGNGKTAIKVSLSRYVEQTATDFASANNPISTTRSSVTQAWADNGDFIPQPNELSGPDLPSPLGSQLPQTTYDNAVREGWGVRRNNWEFSAGFQHEVLPRVGTDVTYFRRAQGNFTATDNRAVTPADYDHFCVTAPIDERLPANVSGAQVCGLYNIQQAKSAILQDNFVTFNDAARARQETWQGVDISVNARISRDTFLQGGLSTGSTHTVDCGITRTSGSARPRPPTGRNSSCSAPIRSGGAFRRARRSRASRGLRSPEPGRRPTPTCCPRSDGTSPAPRRRAWR
jgi:hypothetical protein